MKGFYSSPSTAKSSSFHSEKFPETISTVYLALEFLQNELENLVLGELTGVNLSGFVSKDNPEFTNSLSLGRTSGTAKGQNSVALGNNVTASASYSCATGLSSVASGIGSHAEGRNCVASGENSHAEGRNCESNGLASHAEGYSNLAKGMYSHAEGQGNIAFSESSHVEGKFAIDDSEGKYVHIVGNGTGSSYKSNAHTLDWDGNAWYKGNVSVNGTPSKDADLTTKKYVDNKISNMFNINANGELEITINGTTLTFVPKQ